MANRRDLPEMWGHTAQRAHVCRQAARGTVALERALSMHGQELLDTVYGEERGGRMTGTYFSFHPNEGSEFEPTFRCDEHSGTYWVHFGLADNAHREDVSVFFSTRKGRQLFMESLRYQVEREIKKITGGG